MKRISPIVLLIMVLFGALGCSVQDEQLGLNEEVALNRSNTQGINTPRGQVESDDISLKSGKIHTLTLYKEIKLWAEGIPAGPEPHLTIHGVANIAHMGKSTLLINETINTSDEPWTATATVTLTAPNGDKVLFTYTATIDRTKTPDFIFTGSGSVTDGTGKFKNAKGDLIYNGSMNWATAIGSATFNGDITY